MTKTTIALAIFLVVIHEIKGQCLTANDQKQPQSTSWKHLYTGEQEFSIKLLRAVNRLDPEGNLFFSPYSTYHALLLAYFISAGKTEQYLKNTLHLDTTMDKADLMNAYKFDKIQMQWNSLKKDYEFTSANKIYLDEAIRERDCVRELFNDEFEKINFHSKPDESRIQINKWVENQTHDMIKDLLPAGSIDQTTNLALVNAAYFKGNWKYEFNATETKEDVFHITPSKRTLVNMMHMEGVLSHVVSEVLDAHVLELPYKGENVSMYILLPPFLKEGGVANTLSKLTTDNFRKITKNLSEEFGKTVQVYLPKFTLEHTIEMTPILESLGIGNLFKSDADFSVLSAKDKVSVGAGIHKAKIDVNEQGSEAAAATALFGFRMMTDEPEVVTFQCNHPFIFLLYDKVAKSILFVGVYKQPKY